MNFGYVLIPILIVLIFILCFPLFSYIHKKQSSMWSGIRNYNDTMTEFCYRVPHSKSEIIMILNVPNVYDELKYIFDPISMIITFNSIEHGGTVKYQLIIQEKENECLFRVEAVSMSSLLSLYAILQNSFWANKIQAEPVRYFKSNT